MPASRLALLAIVALVVTNLFLLTPYAQPQIATVNCILTGTSVTPAACIGSAVPLALIGVLVSMMIGALVFMIGEVFNYQPLKGFYKRELWETLKSALIIAIIFSVLIIVSYVAVSFAGSAASTSSGPVQLTDNLAGLYTAVNTTYLQPQIHNSISTFGGLMGLSIGTDILKSFSVSVWFPIPIWLGPLGIVGAVQSGAQASILQTNYIDSPSNSNSLSLISITTIYVTTVLVVFLFQSDLLYVIAAIGLGVLIPIGIIMRTFPFIRGIGGTLIALGIGISIVYPVLLLGLNLPVTNYIYGLTSTSGPGSSSCPGIFPGLICSLWTGFNNIVNAVIGVNAGNVANGATGGVFGGTGIIALAFGTHAISSIPNAAVLGGAGFWTGLLGPFGGYGNGSGIFPALNFVIDNSLDQIVQFILFILDIIIGYATVNGIAGILGGKITLGIGKRFRLA